MSFKNKTNALSGEHFFFQTHDVLSVLLLVPDLSGVICPCHYSKRNETAFWYSIIILEPEIYSWFSLISLRGVWNGIYKYCENVPCFNVNYCTSLETGT